MSHYCQKCGWSMRLYTAGDVPDCCPKCGASFSNIGTVREQVRGEMIASLAGIPAMAGFLLVWWACDWKDHAAVGAGIAAFLIWVVFCVIGVLIQRWWQKRFVLGKRGMGTQSPGSSRRAPGRPGDGS